MSKLTRREFLKATGTIATGSILAGNGLFTNNAEAAEGGASTQAANDVISLPKGGGAIKGIGETFKPTLFTGTANFSVPIATSPGRGGFGPEMTIQYSSGNGNGPFGLGWQLSIPRITRKTEKGLPTYTKKDVFVMSGAEDLVPHLDDNGNPVKVTGQGGYSITRYRPRTEGLFARIEKWIKGGEIHWRAITKENVTSIYGKSKSARIVDPDKPLHTFEWLLEETFDAKGNHILYEYAQENPHQDIEKIYEKNRKYTQAYIRRIFYGNTPDPYYLDVSRQVGPKRSGTDHQNPTQSITRQYLFETVFDYEDLPDPLAPGFNFLQHLTQSQASDWLLRPDPFSSFRPGFEIRTLRRCKRVLILHHFKEGELTDAPLVKSTDIEYHTNEDTQISFLKSVTVKGYRKDPKDALRYKSAKMPPVTFKYSEFKPNEQKFTPLEAKGGDTPPSGLNNPNFAMVDLFGDGLPDLLQTTNNAYYYWRNLGKGVFDRRNKLKSSPAGVTLDQEGAGFGDMAGDGQADLLDHRGNNWGFYEATNKGGWKNFKPYKFRPSFNLNDPNIKLVDLTGDGKADVLRSDDTHFTYFPCLGEEGFDEPVFRRRRFNLEDFPNVFFSDSRVRLADMSGDGLKDIVFIHSGRIDYWPNLGYGEFGKRVTMKKFPRFEKNFDPKRLFLVDINGSGPADLVYVESGRVRFWFNQSGNGWSEENIINGTPNVTDLDSLDLADIYGTGTVGILYSTNYRGAGRSNYWYLDFSGGVKPHVLTEMSNNMGATTRAQYAPSTKFYLEDKKKWKPWATNLPFPVQVLEKTEVIDHISKTKLVTTYEYHHGYYDGQEREFRGFGRVDQYDTEEFETFANSSLHDEGVEFHNNQKAYHVPPVLTKTWFHSGIYFDKNITSANGKPYDKKDMMEAYRDEFYKKDKKPFKLDEHDVKPTNTPHEAYRALRGSIICSEVYALDSDNNEGNPGDPYTVSENRYEVKQLQTALKEGIKITQHGVYLSLQKESLSYHYERNPDDPRTAHQINLKYDGYGNLLESVSISYPRRSPLLDEQSRPYPEQSETKAIYTFNKYINEDKNDKYYYIGLPCEAKTFEVHGLDFKWPGSIGAVTPLTASVFDPIKGKNSYEDYSMPKENIVGFKKRIIEWTRQYYRKNQNPSHIDPVGDFTHRLDFGTVESLVLPYEAYQAAFTKDFISNLLPVNINDNKFQTEGGYHKETQAEPGPEPDSKLTNCWWIPSGRQSFNSQKFFLSEKMQDPFGNNSFLVFDDYSLLMKIATDAVGNVITAENDYQVLQPYKIKDPNDNYSQVAFDAMGMVVGTAIWEEDENGNRVRGDSLQDFVPDLDEAVTKAHIDAPLKDPHSILNKATTRLVYDLNRYHYDIKANRAPRPNVVYTLARKTHDTEEHGKKTEIQHSFVYSDGFGRELQTKVQAEPDPAAPNKSRWVGTGTTVYNNKGKAVVQYEPFFSSDHKYKIEKEGVSPTLFYDPLERIICTIHPNNTYEKVVFDPWQQKTWDANDTVTFNPLSDNDVKGYVTDYFQQKYGTSPPQTWYEERINGSNIAEKEAAQKTTSHEDTHTIAHLDTLGRTYLTIQDNGPRNEDKYSTHVILDIEGNDKIITDPRKIDAFEHTFDMAGRKIHVNSVDAGNKFLLPTVDELPLRSWDANGNEIKTEYDALRRPVKVLVIKDGATRLVNLTQYGDEAGITDAKRHKLCGQVYRVLDDTGEVIISNYDFKSNILTVQRKLLQDYKLQVDWNSAASPAFETDANGDSVSYSATNVYDALNQLTSSTAPDGSVHKLTYNEANFLETVKVRLSGETDDRDFVTNIEYNAKGQREKIEYGNHTWSEYTYDPKTYRLLTIVTKKSNGDIIQDLRYIYDPVGNITQIHDAAFHTVFNHNQRVDPINKYKYDPIYRLIKATGREHGSMTACHYQTKDKKHTEFIQLPNQPINNGQNIYNYTQTYQYDASGNITQTKHVGKKNWTHNQEYDDASNRIKTSKAGCPSESAFNYIEETDVDGNKIKNTDDNGNILKMPHLNEMKWDYSNRLIEVVTNIQTNVTNDRAYYQYDARGQRVRKVIEQGDVRVEERIYVGGYEIYRKYNGSGPTFERSTLHVMDDKKRIALIEKKIKDINNSDTGPDERIRFQLDNHLGSSLMEVDDSATSNEISYEEYYPYGGTAYIAGEHETEVKLKRYRYSGKERDDETGLYYYGARYYMPWLGRWCSADPAGMADGINLCKYARNNPILFGDPTGTQSEPMDLSTINTDPGEVPFEINPETGRLKITVSLSENIEASSLKGGSAVESEGIEINLSAAEKANVTEISGGIFDFHGKGSYEPLSDDIVKPSLEVDWDYLNDISFYGGDVSTTLQSISYCLDNMLGKYYEEIFNQGKTIAKYGGSTRTWSLKYLGGGRGRIPSSFVDAQIGKFFNKIMFFNRFGNMIKGIGYAGNAIGVALTLKDMYTNGINPANSLNLIAGAAGFFPDPVAQTFSVSVAIGGFVERNFIKGRLGTGLHKITLGKVEAEKMQWMDNLNKKRQSGQLSHDDLLWLTKQVQAGKGYLFIRFLE